MTYVSQSVMDRKDITLPSIFRLLLAGPSGCGKSSFLVKLLQNDLRGKWSLLERLPENIVWVYSEWQPLYSEITTSCQEADIEINFVKNIFEAESLIHPENINWLVVDDAMGDMPIDQETELLRWFVKRSHHRQTSVVYMQQNIFAKTPLHRTISLNCTHFVIFKNPRDKTQIEHLAKQMFPGKGGVSFIRDAYQKATETPYSYIMLDMMPTTPEELRVRANLFDRPYGEIDVYIPKK